MIDVLWLALAAWSMWLLLRAVGASRLAAAAGYVAYPLFLTGAWYTTGYSELPALALVPFVPALWARGAPAGAGAVLGVAILFRPDYTLILLGLLGAAIWLERPRTQPLRRSLARLGTGFGGAIAVLLAIVAARGELAGFWHTMVANLGYPNRALRVELDLPTGLRGHVNAIREIVNNSPLAAHTAIRVGLVLALGIAPALFVLLRERVSPRLPPRAAVAGLLLVAAATTVVTLCLTALWHHHLEPLALPAALLAVFLVAALETGRGIYVRALAASAVVAVCLLGLGGASRGPFTTGPLSQWWTPPTSTPAAALNTARVRLYGARPVVTYVHLGENDEEGSAAFLRPGFELACPQLEQYTFSSNLPGILACLRRSHPDLVLVTPSFEPAPHAPVWNAFVRAANALLRQRYVQTLTMPQNHEEDIVWRPKAA